MKYCSVRGGVKDMTFVEAVLAGWAPDGGMILPQELPKVGREALKGWKGLSYTELAKNILTLFVEGELPELGAIIDRSLSVFGSDEVVGMAPLPATSTAAAREGGAAIWLAELWHGPTLAFKDLGMQILCNVLQHLLEARKTRLCALVSTSGDTGPSAMGAIQGLKNLDVIVIYPRGRVSRVQEAQMLSYGTAAENCVIASAEGTSDDIDVPCMRIFEDAPFREKHHIGSVNSVNVLRLLGQVAHFFYAYLRVFKDHACWDDPEVDLPEITFSVPTGAGGHVVAGLIAKDMRLPVKNFIVAVNKNDCFNRMLRDGVLEASKLVHLTAAPAMDIAAPYNVERLLWLLTGGDSQRVAEWMRRFNAGEAVQIPPDVMAAIRERGLVSATIPDGENGIHGCIRSVYEADGYLLDPHTAVGVSAAKAAISNGSATGEVVCMGCAHPAKFIEAVAESLGVFEADAQAALPDQGHASVAAVITATAGCFSADSAPCFRQGEDWADKLKGLICEVTARREKEESFI